tara:strand:- start:561 stop:782 length:222 start_codon:yes stop_codon:yes gene_type:complete
MDFMKVEKVSIINKPPNVVWVLLSITNTITRAARNIKDVIHVMTAVDLFPINTPIISRISDEPPRNISGKAGR